MQIAQAVHSVIAILFVALILGHIYIGTLGMEGAFEAMATGEVDFNWAKEHHNLWLEEQMAKRRSPDHPQHPSTMPAERSQHRPARRARYQAANRVLFFCFRA